MKKPRGNCYAATEALWHILGGTESKWQPAWIKFRNDTHWFLRNRDDWSEVLDPSRLQFPPGTKIPYAKGKGCGFLTKEPSRKARKLMEQLTWQHTNVIIV